MDYKLLYLLFMIVVFFCVGMTCTLFPHWLQLRAKQSVRMGITGKIPALHRFVSSAAYLFHIRAIGVTTLLASVVLALTAILKLHSA